MDIQVDLHFPSHVSLEARDLISKVRICDLQQNHHSDYTLVNLVPRSLVYSTL